MSNYTRKKYKKIVTRVISNSITSNDLIKIQENKIGNHNLKKAIDLEKLVFKEIGIIYYIADIHNTYIRIGKTKNLANLYERFRKHQSGSPLQLYLVAIQTSDCYHQLDRQLQEQFKVYRLHSDWYSYVSDIKDHIEQNCLAMNYKNNFYPDTNVKDIY